MACIYFTARQPVDFSFLHYASPSLSIFFSLLPSLDAFPPRFSSLPPLSPIVPLSFLLRFFLFVLHAPPRSIRGPIPPFPDLSRRAALLEASARARFARENGPHTAETTRRNRRREERIGVATKEFGIARILNENSRVRGRRGR